MEYSVHEVPRAHRDEVKSVFPGTDLTGLLIIPTCQHSRCDLISVGPDVDNEKDFLLERFMEWAKRVCGRLIAQGHWADYVDPCSGLPMMTKVNAGVYSEVGGLVSLLGYAFQNAGCCKVLLHPRWGSSVYPASMFTKAPLRAIQAAIAATEAELRAKKA